MRALATFASRPPVTMVRSVWFVSGTMNTYYLFKTTVECVDAAAEADASKRICDLNSFATLVLLLSTQPPLALCRTSDTIGGHCAT